MSSNQGQQPPLPHHNSNYPPPPPGQQSSQQQEYGNYAPPSGPPPSQHYDDYAPPSGPPPGYQAFQEPQQQQQHPMYQQQPPYQQQQSGYQPQPGYQQQAYEQPPPPTPPRPTQAQGQAAASASGSSKPSIGERLAQWSIRASGGLNKLTNRLGSEAFLPSTLDLECDKAARILKSFCRDGFYGTDNEADARAPGSSASGPKSSRKSLLKIPARVIQSAAGIAIFTTARMGLHLSGAGGSGIVVARLPDGSWSPPSGFYVHTLGAGFMIGLDIYDCVCILRTQEAVRAFTHPRVSLGGEIGLVAGPVGGGQSIEAALSKKDGKPVWSYMKSRGLYAGIQADGTIIISRGETNAMFYGQKLSVEQILSGQVPRRGPTGMWPEGARRLMEVLKASEGRAYDESAMREVGGGPTPGDLGMGEKDSHVEYYGPPAGQ